MGTKLFIFLIFSVGLIVYSSEPQNCFLLYDLKSNKTLKHEGDCNVRMSPCSTFKIALSLMGYDSGILKDTKFPTWTYSSKYKPPFQSWKQPQDPTMWIKNSCVWYSQVLTQKMGIEKFKHYLKSLSYGNQDVSGDPGKNNGLTNAWLSSSLKISPFEQIQFLIKVLKKEYTLSDNTYDMTKQVLFTEKLNNGWELYGKTGTGWAQNQDGTLDNDKGIGWFIGWVIKDDKTLVFVKCGTGEGITGMKMKEQTKKFFEIFTLKLRKNGTAEN
jgi:beta-lactamase class D